MSQRRSLDTVLKWVVVFILTVAALKLVFAVLGIAFFVGGFLLFRVLPLVLLVWLVLRVLGWFSGPGSGDTPPSTIDP